MQRKLSSVLLLGAHYGAVHQIEETALLKGFDFCPAFKRKTGCADVIEVDRPRNLSGGDEAAASGSPVVSERHFQTAAVSLLRGRFFDSSDGPHSASGNNQPINGETFWPGGNPIGQRFRYGVPGESPSVWRVVIGIIGDTPPDVPESQIFPQFFLPQSQLPWTAS